LENLIYDVGAHLGEDSQHYLAKGFKVVAVEANPDLASHLRKRFASEIADGRLKLVECIISEETGHQTFYVDKTRSVWGTAYPQWAARNARLGSKSHEIRLPSRPFGEIMKRFGVPYYLKIDVEGADMLCVEALRFIDKRPKYVSIESEKASWVRLLHEFDELERLGYRNFKVINQENVHARHPHVRGVEGNAAAFVYEPGSSGLFGRDLPGRWLTRREALLKYRLIFLHYYLFGDDGKINGWWITKILRRIPILGRITRPGWYDTHARLAQT
jgi:FkbM family methyltransferase